MLTRLTALALLGCGCLALSGCMSLWPFGQSEDSPANAGPPPMLSAATPSGNDPAIHILIPKPVAKVRMLKLSMPLGTFSLNDKVWRQLDEDALGSQTSVLLAQNGLRAAVGPQSRWPAIAKMVDLPGSTTQEYFCQTDGRSTVNIVTRASIPEQNVFYVDKDGQLQGRTFDRCDNSVRLSMNHVKDSTDLVVQLEPVVLVGTIDVLRGSQELGVSHMTVPQEETFANLRLAATLKADNFLVIAPADPKAAGSVFSVGTRFLSDADKVPPMETVLVFVPVIEAKK